MNPPTLVSITPGVHIADAPLRFAGVELGARMTVLDLEGGLLVHSPIAMDPDALGDLGDPRWVLAPNLMHHLYVAPWAEAGLEAWACPGLDEKRPDVRFDGVLETGASVFGAEIEVLTLESFGLTREAVILHKPSRTLVACDLLFNIAPTAPWMTRAAMWLAGGYPGCQTTIIERVGMKRDIAREEIQTIAGWDFDRVIMSHGEVIETGGREALLHAFRWLGLESAPT